MEPLEIAIFREFYYGNTEKTEKKLSELNKEEIVAFQIQLEVISKAVNRKLTEK